MLWTAPYAARASPNTYITAIGADANRDIAVGQHSNEAIVLAHRHDACIEFCRAASRIVCSGAATRTS
jgi:hypothetical protein